MDDVADLSDRVRSVIVAGRDELRREIGDEQTPCPSRSGSSQRPNPTVPSALLVAIATSTAVFTATPFFLSSVAEQYDVAIGTAGLTSTAQLGGFVVASWWGRPVPPSGSRHLRDRHVARRRLEPRVGRAPRSSCSSRSVSSAGSRSVSPHGSPGRRRSATPAGPATSPSSARWWASSPPRSSRSSCSRRGWTGCSWSLAVITALPLDLHPPGSPPRPPPSAPHPPRGDTCGEGNPVRAHPAHARWIRRCSSTRRRSARSSTGSHRSRCRCSSAPTRWRRSRRRDGPADAGRPASGS